MKVVIEYVHLVRVFFRVFLHGRHESKSQQKTLPEGAEKVNLRNQIRRRRRRQRRIVVLADGIFLSFVSMDIPPNCDVECGVPLPQSLESLPNLGRGMRTGMARRRADRDKPCHSISQARRPRRAVPLFPLFEKGEDN